MKIRSNPFFPANAVELTRSLGVYWRELYQTLEEMAADIAAGGGGGGGGTVTFTEVEIDFGNKPVYDASFTITDATISSSSDVAVHPSGKAATGRTSDDWQWDGAIIAVKPASGSATCYATFHPGPIMGRRKFLYEVR